MSGRDLVMYTVAVLCTILSLVSELCVHVTVHVKQSRIEDRAGVSVHEIRSDLCQAQAAVLNQRKKRNMVSASNKILHGILGEDKSYCNYIFC